MTTQRFPNRFLGSASGPDRARTAIDAALESAGDITVLERASRVVVGIACDESLRLDEVELVMERMLSVVPESVALAYGTRLDRSLNGELRVSVGCSTRRRSLDS